MALEWLRRTDPRFARHLKTFLFTEGPITEIEAEMVHGAGRRRAPGQARAQQRRQPGHRQPAQSGRRQVNHLSRPRADHSGRLGRDRAGSAPDPACAAGGAPRRRLQRSSGLGRLRRRAGPRRSDCFAAERQGRQARLRRIQPLVELRIPFDVSRAELDAIDRGARDPDLDSRDGRARLRSPKIARSSTVTRRRDHGYLPGSFEFGNFFFFLLCHLLAPIRIAASFSKTVLDRFGSPRPRHFIYTSTNFQFPSICILN